MNLTIENVMPFTWPSGILTDNFRTEGGAVGSCNSILYRARMENCTVVVKSALFKRGFAFATMPLNWSPKVGDTISIPASELK